MALLSKYEVYRLVIEQTEYLDFYYIYGHYSGADLDQAMSFSAWVLLIWWGTTCEENSRRDIRTRLT